MDIFRWTTEEFEGNITTAKNVFVTYLYDSKYLTFEQAQDLTLNTAILVKKPTFFSGLWKHFNKKDHDNLQFIVIEQKTISRDPEDGSTSEKKNNLIKLVPKKEKEDPEKT